jgi:hypothetical protein
LADLALQLAACESFMKTLKYEEVYRNEYRDFHDARASIGEFLERVYNQQRLTRLWAMFRRAVSQAASGTAVITKTLRVLLLTPVLVIISRVRQRGGIGASRQIKFPWFVFWFLLRAPNMSAASTVLSIARCWLVALERNGELEMSDRGLLVVFSLCVIVG